MSQTGMKQKFRIEDDGVVRITWDNKKGQTEIYSERKQKEMIQQTQEISAPKNNRGFSHCVIVSMLKKNRFASRLETQQK